MSIPSEEELLQLLELSSVSLEEMIEKIPSISIEYDELYEFYKEYYFLKKDKANRHFDSDKNWFTEQFSYRKAINSLYKNTINNNHTYDLDEVIKFHTLRTMGRCKIVSKEELLQERVFKNKADASDIEVETELLRVNDEAHRLNQLHNLLKYQCLSLDATPQYWIVSSFHSYFYEDKNTSLMDNRKRLNQLFFKGKPLAEKLITVLAECESSDILIQASGSLFMNSEPFNLINHLKDFVDNLELESQNDVFGIYPINRLDETSLERVLMHDLWFGFRSYFRKRKTAAIFHLMSLDGIKNNDLEMSTVDRNVKKWEKWLRNYSSFSGL